MPVLTEMVIALGRIVATRVAGTANAVLANLAMMEETIDDLEAETSTDEPLYVSPGLYGRPDVPVAEGMGVGNRPAGQAEIVGLRIGDHVLPVACRDLRISAKVNPKEGEVGLAQYRGGFVSLKTNATDDGTDVVIYAPHNTALGVADKAHAISLDSTTANSSIVLVHSFGHSVALTKDGETCITNKQGTGFVLIKDDAGGVVLSAPAITLNGTVTAGTADPVTANLVVDGIVDVAALDFVALAAKVLLELQAIKAWADDHVHTGVTAGGAVTAVPSVPLPAPGSVAAVKVQAK